MGFFLGDDGAIGVEHGLIILVRGASLAADLWLIVESTEELVRFLWGKHLVRLHLRFRKELVEFRFKLVEMLKPGIQMAHLLIHLPELEAELDVVELHRILSSHIPRLPEVLEEFVLFRNHHLVLDKFPLLGGFILLDDLIRVVPFLEEIMVGGQR